MTHPLLQAFICIYLCESWTDLTNARRTRIRLPYENPREPVRIGHSSTMSMGCTLATVAILAYPSGDIHNATLSSRGSQTRAIIFVSSWNSSFQKPPLRVVDNLSSAAHKEATIRVRDVPVDEADDKPLL